MKKPYHSELEYLNAQNFQLISEWSDYTVWPDEIDKIVYEGCDDSLQEQRAHTIATVFSLSLSKSSSPFQIIPDYLKSQVHVVAVLVAYGANIPRDFPKASLHLIEKWCGFRNISHSEQAIQITEQALEDALGRYTTFHDRVKFLIHTKDRAVVHTRIFQHPSTRSTRECARDRVLYRLIDKEISRAKHSAITEMEACETKHFAYPTILGVARIGYLLCVQSQIHECIMHKSVAKIEDVLKII